MSYGWFLDGVDYSVDTQNFYDSFSYNGAPGNSQIKIYTLPAFRFTFNLFAYALPKNDIIDTAVPKAPTFSFSPSRTLRFSPAANQTSTLTVSGGNCPCTIVVTIK